MANVELTKDSKPSDFFCPCCKKGELDESFMRQLLRFLEFTHLSCIDATSGYRCSKHNDDVGGKPDSMHLTGRALDLFARTVQAKTIIINAAHQAGFNGIGLGATLVHLDNREIPASWTYPKKS